MTEPKEEFGAFWYWNNFTSRIGWFKNRFGLWCPCCGHKLRTRPTNFSKTKLREKSAIEKA